MKPARTSPQTNLPITSTVDNCITAVMRLVLAASALAISLIEPVETNRLAANLVTYVVLSLYTALSHRRDEEVCHDHT